MKKRALAIAAICLFFAAATEAITPEQIKRIDQLKKNAVEAFQQGNFSQAITFLKDVLSLNPMDKTAARYLMLAERQVIEPYCRQAAEAYQEKNYEKALEQWEKVLKMNPGDVRVEGLVEMTRTFIRDTTLETSFALVDRFLKEGNYPMAVNELRKILLIQPENRQARELLSSANQAITNAKIKELYERADAHLRQQQYDLAIQEWKKILEIDENQEAASRLIASTIRDKMDSLYGRAEKLFRDGDYVGSRDLYFQIMSDNPTDTDVKNLVEKLNETIKVVQRIPESGAVWDMLRKALYNHIAKDGNIRAAIAATWYAVQLEPENTVALAVRDHIERKHLSVVRSMEPPARDMNIIDQYLFASLNHIYEGRYDLAIQAASIVIQLQPNNILALKRLGSAYYAMGKKDKAREAWEKALGLSPDDTELKQFIKQVK